MKEFKEEVPDISLKKYCIFAVGDTFGNVGLFRESVAETGTKSEPLFVYRNTESAYSIESLCFDPSGKLLIASTTKHFVILFYLDSLDFFDKKVRRVSPREYFKQNHLISNKHLSLCNLTYKNLKSQVQEASIQKRVEQPVSKMNKPVFYRKGSNAHKTVQVKTKPMVSTVPKPVDSMEAGGFMLKNEKSSFLKEKKPTQFISVVNFLKPISPLVVDKVFPFADGSLIYSIFGADHQGNQVSTNRAIVPALGISQGNNSGFFDMSTTRSVLKLVLHNLDSIQWEKKFAGVLQALEMNSKYVVFLDSDSKLNVLRTCSGRKALFSIEAFNMFCLSLSDLNSLLLVRRNGFFSVIDLDTQAMKYSGNCFELLRHSQTDPDSLLGDQEIRFILDGRDTIFLKVLNTLYLYNRELQEWQGISNTIFFTAFEGQPNKLKQFDLRNFPNDPGEIFDDTPFKLLQASREISER